MEKSICSVFDQAQRSTQHHEKLARQLLTDIGRDFDSATPILQSCFDLVAVTSKNEMSVKNFMKFLGVVVTEANRLDIDADGEGETEQDEITEVHPVTLWMMTYALTCARAADKVVRMRGCEIGAIVMKYLPEDTDLAETVWTISMEVLQERLNDKQASVRVQAIHFAQRLQSPSPDGELDPITKALVRITQHDSSVQCRRAAVQTVAVTKHTLDAILSRTRDVSDGVRATVLDVVREMVPLTVLPIAKRTRLLDQALRDNAESVRAAGTRLCIHWLNENANNDVLEFLNFLDVENLQRDTTSIVRCLISLIDSDPTHRSGPLGDSLFRRQVPFYGTMTKNGGIGSLTVEASFLCRMVCEYLFEKDGESNDDRLEVVRPAMVDVAAILKTALSDGAATSEFVIKQVRGSACA